MQVSPMPVTVREIIDGYADSGDDGVVAFGGRLDARPKYQREFIYKPPQQQAVIETVLQGAPLSILYWAEHVDPASGNVSYEILDGQQRTLSLCRYVAGDFPDNRSRFFRNLPSDLQDRILDYQLLVYVCQGTESEKLDWFQRINIAGEPLNAQELRNAIFAGPWLADAKKFFSKPNGGADTADDGLVTGDPLRQQLLEKALAWIVDLRGLDSIETYMALHQHDQNAGELKSYYREVCGWANDMFPVERSQRVGQPWGLLFNAHKGRSDLDPQALEARIKTLFADEDVTKKSGVYQYLLTDDPKYLHIRAFTDTQKVTAYEQQHGKCAAPGWTGHDPNQVFEIGQMEGDHKTPWSQGGHTTTDNLQMLCKPCNRAKRGI